MLQILRNSVASIFTKALLGLIMISFAVWGMGDVFGGGFFGNTVAEVGSVKINANDIHNQYQRELDRLRRMNIDLGKSPAAWRARPGRTIVGE